MRFMLIIGALIVPHLVVAQSAPKDFSAGTYILNDGHNTRQQSQLKLRGYNKLLVKAADGKVVKYTPAQISAFWLNGQQYITVGHFIGTDVELESAFVALVDSGRVMLTRFNYEAPKGIERLGLVPDTHVFLLKNAQDSRPTRVEHGIFLPGGKVFIAAVRPYIASRPDLVKLLDENIITFNNLPAAIHALNTNTPFTPPEAPVKE